MPNITKYVLLCFLLLFVTNLHAFVLDTKPTVLEQEKKEPVTIEQFIVMTPASMEAATGKKMGWGKRQLFKLAQRRIKKRLAKGEVQLNDEAFEDEASGLLSSASLTFGLIGSVVILLAVLLFLTGNYAIGWILLLLAILSAIVAIVLGILGLKREDKPIMAIIGLILGIGILLPIVLSFLSSLIFLF